MPLQIVGAGWSRTGTFSLKCALEQLGFGPCYHTHELFAHPEHVAMWQGAGSGRCSEWDAIFERYAAACDAPACIFWRELSDYYPDARVILTLRDAQDWYASMDSTVVEMMRHFELVPDPHARAVLETAHRLVLQEFFGGKFDDQREAVARFNAHNEAVRATIAPRRLLVYEVSAGWEPLCRFLDVAVPELPFPRTNDRASFRARAALPRGASG